MKILVATDFSANASHAVKYAGTLAKAFGAEIILLCICAPPLLRNDASLSTIEDEIKRAEHAALVKLEAVCREIIDSFGITCLTAVRTGGVASEIIQAAIDYKADVITMGTTGASGIGRFLFGSNTGEVIEGTPCPVLAVPPDAPISLPKKIVYATNFYDSDKQTLIDLNVLVGRLNAELTILHVSKEKIASEEDLIEEFSRTVARETGRQAPFYYVLKHSDTQEGINFFIDSVGADLIALSTRKRREFEKLFNRSLTKKIAYQARLPLLAFHAGSPTR